MSVWQEWLISLAHVFPQTEEEQEVTDLVYDLFGILLYHAIRLEYGWVFFNRLYLIDLGGWRVWVDTLAIAHSKISLERARLATLQKQQNAEAQKTPEEQPPTQPTDQKDSKAKQKPNNAPYRTPEFVWSRVHIRLLDDLLTYIEKVVESWSESSTAIVDYVCTCC